MRNELAKHEKPQLRQKIRDCEMELSRHDLEAGNLKNKLESVRQALGKAKSGRGDLEGKLRDYQAKAAASKEVREKIEKARGIAEKIIREKQGRVGDLNRQRDELRGEMRKLEGDLRENLSLNE
jgi:chromosome segregation ATPase